MKNIIKTVLIIITILIAAFVLVFFAGKNILPKLMGNSSENISVATSTVADQKLLDNKAPYFDLSDISGNRVRLSDFLNQPLILVFWATWNQSSADQIKILDDYISNKSNQSSLVKIVAIDSLEDPSLVKSFIKRGSYNVPISLDVTGDVSNKYNIKSLPTTYFIDKDGIIRDIHTGILSESMIVDKVENILK
jgi:peroxiredoxin